MRHSESIRAGDYFAQLEKKVNRVTRKANKRKKRRIAVLIITVLICASAVFWGTSNKNKTLEKEYLSYCETKNRELLNSSLFEYRETKELFERTSLGNTIIQSHMNGLFYEDGRISAFPDDSGTKIALSGKTRVLSNDYASHINVFEDTVYYKDIGAMMLKEYDIATGNTTNIDIDYVGQFAVCDGMIVYVDTSNNELKIVENEDTTEKFAEDVVTFSVVGNDIIYLKQDKSLHSVSMTTKIDTVLGNHINSYVYDGSLWIQNNFSIFSRKLSDNKMELLEVDVQCHRILGATDAYLLIDDGEGICAIHKNTHQIQKLESDLIFVGASNDGELFVYNTADHQYGIEHLN